MGDFFLKSINEDNIIVLSSYNKNITDITDITDKEFKKIKFLKLKFKDSKKEYSINTLTKKVTNLKQNCICGSGKKLKRCSNHSRYLYDFCFNYALMKRKEEEFWININNNNNNCCGFSNKCKIIKKLEKGDKKMDEFESKKLENLRWILDKQLGWISTAETKATTFIAFNITSFTVLSYFFEIKSITEFKCEYILPIIAIIFGLFALCKIISVFIPRTDIKGTNENISDSYLYFNLIDKNKKDYNNKVKNQTYEDLENDLINQICINAQIANIKHDLIKKSVIPTFYNFGLTIISILLAILMKLL